MATNDGGNLSHVKPCGCERLASTGAWFSCEAHRDEHPGGWDSWEVYRQAWADVECGVCHQKGFVGTNDFESVGFFGALWTHPDRGVFAPLNYAHRSCVHLASSFPDMRGAATMPYPEGSGWTQQSPAFSEWPDDWCPA